MISDHSKHNPSLRANKELPHRLDNYSLDTISVY
jgi:hypothetical protein